MKWILSRHPDAQATFALHGERNSLYTPVRVWVLVIVGQRVWDVGLELRQQVGQLQQICQLEWRTTGAGDGDWVCSAQAGPGNWQLAQFASLIMKIHLSAAPVVALGDYLKCFPKQWVERMGNTESSSFTVRRGCIRRMTQMPFVNVLWAA